MDGVINIYKEKGYTSHDVVAIVKKTLHVKAGHTGTLDPDATGVLPVCLGKATKIADYIGADVKGYTAVLRLGVETDTQDMTGKVIQNRSTAGITEGQIAEAVQSFQGSIAQIPPMYSAIKVNGEKLYRLARKGIEIERKERMIEIYAIKILKFPSDDTVLMDILCSKGTYIRSLCHDIGQKLGCGGAMESLVRNRSGQFMIDQSISLAELKAAVTENRYDEYIMPIDKVLTGFPKGVVSDGANQYLYNGNKIQLQYVKSEQALKNETKLLAYDGAGKLIGIYIVTGDGFIKPLTILTDLNAAKGR